MKSVAEIKEIMDTILQGTDLFLVDLSVAADNSIEVEIDAPKGVNVDTCREVSRKLEERLDRETEDFALTVCSAGIGYPFKVPQQYEKNIGNTVEVKLANGQKLEGTLKAHTENGITVEVEEKVAAEGKRKKTTVKTENDIQFSEIKEVKDIVTF